MTNNAEIYASRTITAQFIPQMAATGANGDPVDFEPIDFNATEEVLSLFLDEIKNLVTNESIAIFELTGELIPQSVWSEFQSGPGDSFRVDGLANSILEFFDVDDAEDITQEMLNAAKEGHLVNEIKTYTVTVERVEVRQVEVQVNARYAYAATEKAIQLAYDTDFASEGHSVAVNYSCKDIKYTDDAPSDRRLSSPRAKP